MPGGLHIRKLSLYNFRNYADVTVSFIREINCLVGANGSGKTNLLDAIHYLSFCKSAFNPVDRNNIRLGESSFIISGEYLLDEKEEILSCSVQKSKRKVFKRNKKEYEKLADHIGSFPLVIISPADGELITGGSDLRRKMIDSIISQYDKEYLNNLIVYNKALSQRNALLKHFAQTGRFSPSELEIWDEQLTVSGQPIYEKRLDFLGEFIPVFNELFSAISSENDSVTLAYKTRMNEGDFTELLRKSLMRDRALLYTSVGIHKDDLDFCIMKHSLKYYGSQGQQKTYLLALKLAQF